MKNEIANVTIRIIWISIFWRTIYNTGSLSSMDSPHWARLLLCRLLPSSKQSNRRHRRFASRHLSRLVLLLLFLHLQRYRVFFKTRRTSHRRRFTHTKKYSTYIYIYFVIACRCSFFFGRKLFVYRMSIQNLNTFGEYGFLGALVCVC